MFRNREILLSADKDAVLAKLSEQVRLSFVSDKVENDAFSIHCSLVNSSRDRGRFMEYRFHGTVREDLGGVRVCYRIVPPIMWIVVFCVFLLATLQAGIQSLIAQSGDSRMLIWILIPVTMYVIFALECRECRMNFEKKLKEVSYDRTY